MRIIIALLILITLSASYAADPRAEKLTKRDKDFCYKVSSQKHSWNILDSSNWYRAYNQCLKNKLKKLDPIYTKNAVEAQRLEVLCEQKNQFVEVPTEFSRIGLVNALQTPAKEMHKSEAARNLEYHLELYYEKTFQSKDRIQELRKR